MSQANPSLENHSARTYLHLVCIFESMCLNKFLTGDGNIWKVEQQCKANKKTSESSESSPLFYVSLILLEISLQGRK